MKQRVITGTIFAVAVILLYGAAYFVKDLILLMAIVIACFAVFELIRAFRTGGFNPSAPLIVAGCVLCLAQYLTARLFALSFEQALAFYMVLTGIYCLFSAIMLPILEKNASIDTNHGKSFADGIVTAGIVFYVTFPLFCLCATVTIPENGWYYMVVGLFSCWLSDVFAYFTGVLFGKHKIVPHISPKKTVEGCVGGALFCAVIITVYCDLVIYRLSNFDVGIAGFTVLTFIFGIIISCFSQIGDWFASVIKRRVGIKDYGKIFPGHGGMMDRFDSAFFTIPVGCMLALIAAVFL